MKFELEVCTSPSKTTYLWDSLAQSSRAGPEGPVVRRVLIVNDVPEEVAGFLATSATPNN